MYPYSKMRYELSAVITARGKACENAEFAEMLRAHKVNAPGGILATQVLFILIVLAVLWIPPLLM
jgi:hypothetical protein